MPMTRRLALALFAVFLVACGDGDPIRVPEDRYVNGNTPASLLEDFRRTWVNRDIEQYTTLFAEDFTFYFDPTALEENPTLPTFWGRAEGIERVSQLFASEKVEEIRLTLEYDPVAKPVEEREREDWLFIRVTNEKLEIFLKPLPGESEGDTLLIEGKPQDFYFRKGMTEADTLASSPTSGKYKIVRWQDSGGFHDFEDFSGQPHTWSSAEKLLG